jgi:FtsP/CotA-like multicopper oxidase with cupredoxin domain
MQIGTEPSGRTVEVALEARETEWEYADERAIRGFAFNGEVPGPTIEAEVGDTLVVRLTNRLPEPTTIHWHGLRIPAEMDGTELVQRPVEPGESFEYRFVVPDAATFWYHSHVNETEQLGRGLYGASGRAQPGRTPFRPRASSQLRRPQARPRRRCCPVRRRARAARRT